VNQKQAKHVDFVVHWMNNKDFNFTYSAEMFTFEMYEKLRKNLQDRKETTISFDAESKFKTTAAKNNISMNIE
jgi:hypothetical protein